jgi:ABC-type amino acid transport substrate-binding protein
MSRSVSALAFRSAIAAVLAAGVAASAPAAPDGTITTLQPRVLTVCLYPNFAPFVSYDGETKVWSGGDVDFLKAFGEAHGLHFNVVKEDAFQNIWTLPGNNDCDVAGSGISDLPARRQQTGSAGEWSDHYYHVLRGLLVCTKHAEQLKGVCDLRGKEVIVTKDSTADLDITNRVALAGIPESTTVTPGAVYIDRTNDEEQAAKDVRAGKGFAYGGGWGSVQDLAKRLGKLTAVWEHCNTTADGEQVPEPFSFVVRAESTGVLGALNDYIATNGKDYEVPLPNPDIDCVTAPGPPPARSCPSMTKAKAKSAGGRRGGS